jgi:hypothetical protein
LDEMVEQIGWVGIVLAGIAGGLVICLIIFGYLIIKAPLINNDPSSASHLYLIQGGKTDDREE